MPRSRLSMPPRSAAAAPASSRPRSRKVRDDLFGEQVVLCGGLVELIKGGFETLWKPATRRNGLFRMPARGEADRRPDL